VERTSLERRRQEALIATKSATRQKLEQVVADEQRFHAQFASRESELASANAQLSRAKPIWRGHESSESVPRAPMTQWQSESLLITRRITPDNCGLRILVSATSGSTEGIKQIV
jgi:hypothetical protein